MSPRRYSRICREGWSYLAVVTFILGGAVLRENNLLIVLAGLLIGPLVLSWRLTTLMMRHFDVTRKIPRRAAAGEPFTVELDAANRRTLLGSWAMRAEDVVVRAEAGPPEASGPTTAEVLFPYVGRGEHRVATYRCLLGRRGLYRFGPLRLSTCFPLGLIEVGATRDRTETLIVCPRLGRLLPEWTSLLETLHLGTQRSHQQRGPVEGEFYGLRDWRSGDSQRWIHWRTSARLQTLAVRQFEQQRHEDVAMLLDLWQPEQPSQEDAVRVELAVSFVATAITDLCRRSTPRLTLGVAGADSVCWSVQAGRLVSEELLEKLAVVTGHARNRLGETLDRVDEAIHGGAPLIVISTRPAVDPATLLRNADATLRRRPLTWQTWLDVGGERLARYFLLEPPAT